MNLSAVSLVSAVPGLALAYLLVMVIIKEPGFDILSTGLKVFVCLTLVMAVVIVFMPVAILVWAPKTEKEPKDNADETSAGAETVAGAGAVGAAAATAAASDELEFDDDLSDDATETLDEGGEEFDDDLDDEFDLDDDEFE